MWMVIGVGVGVILLVALVVGLMSTVFHSATATVTISEWKSDISGTYQAGGSTALTYTPVTASDTASKSVPATGTTQAQDHASGSITISNLYSTKTQRLITNTRFQTPEGKVYRIHEPVTVPGYSLKNGAKVAGVIDAVVYADDAGESYNIGMTTFTLPGLKGSDQYTAITAKSKTAMTGGFIGTRAVVEQSVRDQAVADLKAQLARTLTEKVTTTAPEGSVVFPDSINIQYTEEPDKGDGSNATITVDGSATAPAFVSDALATALASYAQIVSNAPLSLANPTELTYSAPNGDVAGNGALTFTLAGTAHLVAVLNPNQLAQDLAGKNEATVESIRSAYPAIIQPISIAVYPFWSHSLPANPERIHVVIKGALDQSH